MYWSRLQDDLISELQLEAFHSELESCLQCKLDWLWYTVFVPYSFRWALELVLYRETWILFNLARYLVHKEIPLTRTVECPNKLIKAYKGGKKERNVTLEAFSEKGEHRLLHSGWVRDVSKCSFVHWETNLPLERCYLQDQTSPNLQCMEIVEWGCRKLHIHKYW